jgi:exodeoxyribonuclease-3
MKIITFNVNGLRAALRKGFLDWRDANQPDVILLQEIKTDLGTLPSVIKEYPALLRGWHAQWHPAEKKGYSGVAVLSRQEPTEVVVGCGNPDFDAEGRVLRVALPSGLQVVSLYLPSGSQGDVRQAVKEAFMDYLHQWLPTVPGWNQNLVLAGDFNICHQPIDIHDPVRLKTVSGFLPHERDWFSRFLGLGLVDTFRHLHPNTPDVYSWWAYRAGAKNRNKGWRIDYALVPEALRGQIRSHSIQQPIDLSDHVPCVLELEL